MAGGTTVAVLACGVDYAYPAGMRALLAGNRGTREPWSANTRRAGSRQQRRFLARNRLIAALTTGTVVVEAGLRSGALNTARHARELGRPVMAVPGPGDLQPVRRMPSADPRRAGATCVTSASDVIAGISPATASGRD